MSITLRLAEDSADSDSASSSPKAAAATTAASRPLALQFDRFAVLVFFPDLLFNLAPPAFGNPRTEEPIKQIDKKQNCRHPFVVQGGEEHNENDGSKSRKRSRRAPGDGFETRIAQAAEHHDGKKKHQRWKHPFPATNLMVAFTQPPKHE